uniref:ORF49b n=1 Tax=Pinus koraiensis TaxID=88728 RepID=Q85X56_PINKO|nr:ORF49b [Pinus koraiensis]
MGSTSRGYARTSRIVESSTYLTQIGNTSVSTYFSRRTCHSFTSIGLWRI